MRRIKEVLRLKEGLGLSDTAVSRSVRIARSTVVGRRDHAAMAMPVTAPSTWHSQIDRKRDGLSDAGQYG